MNILIFDFQLFVYLQIFSNIKKASEEYKSEIENRKNVKLTVFSGHDTVIAPVLASLGVYTEELCVWPPYASRIVFELWQGNVEQSRPIRERIMSEEIKERNSNNKNTDIREENRENIFDNSNRITDTKKNDSNNNITNDNMMSYVRVIYNGKDVTMKITACREEINKLMILDPIPSGGNTKRNQDMDGNKIILDKIIFKDHNYYIRNGFCPLSVIEKQSSLMLFPFSSFQEACKY